jgi:ribosome-associated translation inhibitor RaiA
MDIIFHSHHATISPRLRVRTEEGIQKLARRLGRINSATARFAEDGPSRRVEIALNAWRGRRFVAEGTGRYFGPALGEALARIGKQIDHVKRTPKSRARALARA